MILELFSLIILSEYIFQFPCKSHAVSDTLDIIYVNESVLYEKICNSVKEVVVGFCFLLFFFFVFVFF